MAARHPLDPLDAEEIRVAATAVRKQLGSEVRFSSVSLHEPGKAELDVFEGSEGLDVLRVADVVLVVPSSGLAYEVEVVLPGGDVRRCETLAPGVQPPFSPDDCFRAEDIVKADANVAQLLRERYEITDLSLLACDPWSIHLTSADDELLSSLPPTKAIRRLVQTFLYYRADLDDNHYAHPLDMLPIVDLNAGCVVKIEGMQRAVPTIPGKSVNYHRNKLSSNSYLQTMWRSDLLTPLEINQPEGASFQVKGSLVTWQKWSMRVTFNYREGLVLHDVRYEGRSILARASLVEMAVPYGDPHPPFQRKCAFDVGDYGLGYCANSLSLGCDCLGRIHYFDATLSDSKGEPTEMKNVICMHEEDAGLLWKHFEYRNGHSESRRSRRLVLSSIATVVNYEYLFYWYFMQDGSIEYEIKLSGELSTNLLSENEKVPEYGVMVAPGVNAQVHQHMFCMRLDMAVDGKRNSVSEVEVVSVPAGSENPYGNAFRPVSTRLCTELDAQRKYSAGRTWKIFNSSSINQISGKPVAYKLIPYTRGPSQSSLLTTDTSAVASRGKFATKSLWVTPYAPKERYPAGQYPTQSTESLGLPEWTKSNRKVEDEDIVLWHSFGVAHVPRPEDFPVMPCEMTGFSLKPDGFFEGNPSIDLPPYISATSKLCNENGSATQNGSGSNGQSCIHKNGSA